MPRLISAGNFVMIYGFSAGEEELSDVAHPHHVPITS